MFTKMLESPPPRTASRPPVEPLAERDADRPSAPQPPPGAAEMLSQIHDELRAMRRERQYEDFSIARLAAAVAQAIALCLLGAALYFWLDATPDHMAVAATRATIWLLAAIVIQLMALSWFVAARRR